MSRYLGRVGVIVVAVVVAGCSSSSPMFDEFENSTSRETLCGIDRSFFERALSSDDLSIRKDYVDRDVTDPEFFRRCNVYKTDDVKSYATFYFFGRSLAKTEARRPNEPDDHYGEEIVSEREGKVVNGSEADVRFAAEAAKEPNGQWLWGYGDRSVYAYWGCGYQKGQLVVSLREDATDDDVYAAVDLMRAAVEGRGGCQWPPPEWTIPPEQ